MARPKVKKDKNKKTFIWRLPNGTLDHVQAESADQSLQKYGQRLSWDADLNTVEVLAASGKIERYTLTGSY
jgi:hypothetical protein